jgi:type I restriction enzyme S subunit
MGKGGGEMKAAESQERGSAGQHQGAVMKQGWQTKRLGEVCEIIKGRKPTLKATPSNGDLPYLVAKVMRGSKEAEYASVKDRNSITVEESETIIICDGSNSGEVFTGFRGILSSTMGKIATKAEIDDDYLRAFLASTFDVFNGAKTGAAIPHLDKEAMYQLHFPFPSLAEQQRIVGLLDEAFEGLATAKANAEKNLQNARALFESHLHVEHAEKAMLGDLVNIKTGKLDANAAVEGGKFPFFTCSRDIFAIDTYAFDCEAILLAGNNAVGDFNVKHYNGKFNAYQRTYVITVNEKKRVLYRFLYFQMLKSLKKFKSQSVGAGTKFLKLGMIKELEIELPSLDEQQRIVSTMDAVREETQRLARLYERRLAALEALKKSLLHQAFTGEL